MPVLDSHRAVRRRRHARSPRPRTSVSRCSSRRSPAAAGAGCAGWRSPPTCRRRCRRRCGRRESAFGDATVFLEQAVVDPRHIEVQILADGAGRRHPPVRAGLLGAAPAPEGRRDRAGPEPRPRSCASGSARTRSRSPGQIGYVNAGTVEFLLDRRRPARLHRDEPADPGRAHGHRGGHRRRPGAVARSGSPSGETLADLGLSQDTIRAAAAPRCSAGSPPRTRPTASAPTPARSPPTARPAAPGIRLDGGTALRRRRDQRALRLAAGQADLPRPRLRPPRSAGPAGRWPSSASAASPPTSRSCRPCSTTRTSRAGRVTTSFIDEHPHLLTARASADRGTRLLTYLADVTVNKPHGDRPATSIDPREQAARRSTCDAPPPDGSRQRLPRARPGGLRRRAARADRARRSPTPPSGTPTSRCWPPGCAPGTCSPSPGTSPARPRSCCRWSAGAAPPTTSRCASWPRTRGSGWPRCARRCRTSACRCCCAAATPSATRPTRPTVTDAFVAGGGGAPASTSSGSSTRSTTSTRCGRRSTPSGQTGTAVAEVALCYTGDLSDPGEKLYTLDYYLRLAEQIVEAGAHVLAIKDMAGLLRAAGGAHAGHRAARAVRPAGAPAHPRHRGRPARDLRSPRSTAGVDAVDGPVALDGRHHLAAAAVGARRRDRPHRARPPAWTSTAVNDLEPYWEAVRKVYAPFESGLPAPTGRVYHHEIPGGQLSNLRQQADRARPGRPLRGDRGRLRRRRPDARPPGQGDPVVQGGRRPRAAPGRRRGRPRGLRGRPRTSSTSPTR